MHRPRPVMPRVLRHPPAYDALNAFWNIWTARYVALLRHEPELAPQRTEEDVHCPCCGGIFSQFNAFRHKPEHPWRENALCPVCGSLERQRRLWLQLCAEDELFTGGRLLHIAPEPFLREFFTSLGRHDYVDCDLQAERALRQVDITDLPFAEASFDWCLCSHVLEHVDNDLAALAELARVLKPGAVAWLLVPTLKQGTLVHPPPPEGFTPDDHRREYGLEDFVQRCETAGFTVTVLHAKDMDPELRRRHRLSNHIYRCLRQ